MNVECRIHSPSGDGLKDALDGSSDETRPARRVRGMLTNMLRLAQSGVTRSQCAYRHSSRTASSSIQTATDYANGDTAVAPDRLPS